MAQLIEVPQTPYTPPSRFDPQASAFFSTRGAPGVNLRDAYDGNLSSLDYRDYPHHIAMQRITLLIQWPGYDEWVFRNITIMSLGSPSAKHTIHKLVNTLARKIQDFITEMSSVHGRVPGWELQNVDFDALYITELRHVSQGRWMPVLYYGVPHQTTCPVGGAAVHHYNV